MFSECPGIQTPCSFVQFQLFRKPKPCLSCLANRPSFQPRQIDKNSCANNNSHVSALPQRTFLCAQVVAFLSCDQPAVDFVALNWFRWTTIVVPCATSRSTNTMHETSKIATWGGWISLRQQQSLDSTLQVYLMFVRKKKKVSLIEPPTAAHKYAQQIFAVNGKFHSIQTKPNW